MQISGHHYRIIVSESLRTALRNVHFLISSGDLDAAKKAYALRNTVLCPMTQKREVTTTFFISVFPAVVSIGPGMELFIT